ncbi:hypothetical protein NBRGN_038_02400 [Nocardia brasiliensis NBRC 14402]|uniref:hypothetical protein n=1 Tax=Nocardia brasiliensis TaxID=37326 RepID=UPI00045C7630|nr:hypothetical protein [Nocardia brasiliensis]ASF08788.1 hypothetical protein CEQ30_17025 [Nocardia brasiliensis]GAJ81568.1 hypothetical protein NBRGN_038_02400 [Nocardia brasiliensis NBRC 14402]SUB40657.1 Uncharacterised protein [Nocardia brasiliensis]
MNRRNSPADGNSLRPASAAELPSTAHSAAPRHDGAVPALGDLIRRERQRDMHRRNGLIGTGWPRCRGAHITRVMRANTADAERTSRAELSVHCAGAADLLRCGSIGANGRRT